MEQWSPTQDVGNGKRDFKVIPPPRSAPTKRCNQTWRQLHLKSLKVAPAEWSTAQPGKGHSPQPQLQPRTDRIVPAFMASAHTSRTRIGASRRWTLALNDTASAREIPHRHQAPRIRVHKRAHRQPLLPSPTSLPPPPTAPFSTFHSSATAKAPRQHHPAFPFSRIPRGRI